MPFEFKLPDLGEGIEEAQVLVWKVRPGQEVAAFAPLCDVESAKAAVELTSPVGGRVREMRVAEGETARRGEVLIVIDTPGSGPDAAEGASAPAGAAEADDSEWFGIVGTRPRPAPAPPPDVPRV